jgi:hypothetical protein
MLKPVCPKCNSNDFEEFDIGGGVDDGKIIYSCLCLSCDCVFILECEIILKNVTEVTE